MNLSASTDFLLLCVEYISIPLFCKNNCKIHCLCLPIFCLICILIHLKPTHILFGLCFDSFKNFWKALVIITPFLSLKGVNKSCIFAINFTNNCKIWNPLSNLLISCISARSGSNNVFKRWMYFLVLIFSNNWFV